MEQSILSDYIKNYNCTECEYQTEDPNPAMDVIQTPRFVHAVLGLCSETAEYAEATGSHHRDEELGDLVWFTTLAAEAISEAPELLWLEALRVNKVRTADQPLEDLQHATGALADRLKSLLFYQSQTLKPFFPRGGEYKRDKVEPLECLATTIRAVAVAIVGLSLQLEGEGQFERCLLKNLAKLQARHGGAAKSDTRDYDQEKLAMEAVCVEASL